MTAQRTAADPSVSRGVALLRSRDRQGAVAGCSRFPYTSSAEGVRSPEWRQATVFVARRFRVSAVRARSGHVLVVRLSEDDAKTWKASRLVTQGSGGYSDLALARDHRILCLYESGRLSVRDSRLVLARFNLEWLTKE
ncbi:MAG: hypothetical protein ACKV22_17075 [Bryobacteraceae bacterium]